LPPPRIPPRSQHSTSIFCPFVVLAPPSEKSCVGYAPDKYTDLSEFITLLAPKRGVDKNVVGRTKEQCDAGSEKNERRGTESPRGRLDCHGTVQTGVSRVAVTLIAVCQVTAQSVSTQRHTGSRELGTLVNVLTQVVCRCAVSDESTTGRTPGESTTQLSQCLSILTLTIPRSIYDLDDIASAL